MLVSGRCAISKPAASPEAIQTSKYFEKEQAQVLLPNYCTRLSVSMLYAFRDSKQPNSYGKQEHPINAL